MSGPAFMQGLLKRAEDESGMSCQAHPPAEHLPGISVDDEGEIDRAAPGRDIGAVRPQNLLGLAP
jgi:hypothetical protein